MEITVDGVLFTVLERIVIGNYEGLVVTSQKQSVFSMSAKTLVDTLLYVRSNSWGGMFRLCLQDRGGGGYFKKGADYTRSTFVKIELQLHFFKCWDVLHTTQLKSAEHEYCVNATDFYPNKREDLARTIQCPIGDPDYDSIQKIGNYKYDYEVDNVTLCEETKMNEYLALTEAQRKRYAPEIACHQDIRRDPRNVFEPTHVRLTGSIFRISIPGSCPTYFYYCLVNIKTTTAKDDNPIALTNVDERDRMIPLITVPQTQKIDRDCELLGIYSQYAQNSSSSIAKVMEHVQMCDRRGARCTNSYVVNDEYDAPLFAAVRTHTLNQRRTLFKKKFKRLKQNWGLTLRSVKRAKGSKGSAKGSKGSSQGSKGSSQGSSKSSTE